MRLVKQKLLIVATALVTIITLSSFTMEASVPFWGTTSNCTEAGEYLNPETGNYVTYYESCETKYRFWINFGSECTMVYSCP